MPTDLEGIETYLAAKILYGPAKAANAGGVATSGLEMSQNSQRLSWTREEVDHKLKSIMANIHERPGPRPGILFRQILHQLRHRRQHCRLREGGGFHDRPGSGLSPGCDTLAANVKTQQKRRVRPALFFIPFG